MTAQPHTLTALDKNVSLSGHTNGQLLASTSAKSGCDARPDTFEVPYCSEDYLANLATQSGTRALGEARRAEFLTRVRRRLESLGWPQLTATFVGYLTVGRRE